MQKTCKRLLQGFFNNIIFKISILVIGSCKGKDGQEKLITDMEMKKFDQSGWL